MCLLLLAWSHAGTTSEHLTPIAPAFAIKLKRFFARPTLLLWLLANAHDVTTRSNFRLSSSTSATLAYLRET
jgi:hypothetical protein